MTPTEELQAAVPNHPIQNDGTYGRFSQDIGEANIVKWGWGWTLYTLAGDEFTPDNNTFDTADELVAAFPEVFA